MEEHIVTFTENVYAEHLASINGINFTPREIAVIACLLHARGTSRIASFLSIAPRTVVTHIRNIMLKLECNSRESIIDFIEKSHKIPILRTYYESLVVEAAFEKSLQEISRLRHEGSSICILVYWTTQNLKDALIHQLKNHLSKARINAEVRQQTLDQNVENVENLDHALLLLLEKKDQQEISEDFLIFNSVDLSEQKNYYFAVFEILKKLLPNVNLENVLTNFRERSEGRIGGTVMTSSQVSLGREEMNSSGQELSGGKKSIISGIRFKKFLEQGTWPFGWSFLIIVLSGIGFLIQGAFLTHSDPPNTYPTKFQRGIRSDLIIPTDSVLLHRPDLMTQIKDEFKKQRTDIQTVALVGPGGAGKTTAARQYAHKQKASVIWEINAETNTSLNESFENVAYALSTTEEDKSRLRGLQEIKNSLEREKKIIEFVKDKLRLCSNWFLIYDNVESFATIQKYFPLDAGTWGYGRIILTTRDSNIQNNKYVNYTLHVGELNESQKLHLFTKIMDQGTQNSFTEEQTNEAKKFLKAIPPFPLDVSLASYYIKTTNIPYNQYIKLLESNDENITNTQENILKESGDYTKTRYKLVTLSLQKLIAIHKDFGELLLFISLLDSQNIPKELLDRYKSPSMVDNFIYHLKKHSLITTQSYSLTTPALSIHRSTQTIILAYLTKVLKIQEKENNVLIQSISCSLEDYIEKELDKDNILRGRELISHLERFLGHDKLLSEVVRASMNAEVARIYYFLGYYVKAKKILEKSLSILREYYGEDHIKVGAILFYLGMVDRELNNYETVQGHFEKSLKIYQNYGSTYQSKIASIIAYLGIIARHHGDYDKSKHAFEKSLKIYKNYYPKDQIKIAWIIAQSGILKGKLGNYKEAKDLLEQSHLIYKNHFGGNHPESIWVLVKLGAIYRRLGDYKKTKLLLEKSLTIYEKQYSKEHINVAWILSNLAEAYRGLGNYKKAKELQERSVLIYRKNFSQKHENNIDVACALARLGNSYKDLNNFEEAKCFLKTSLQTYEKHYGKNHIATAYHVLESLGQVYLLEGNLKMAEELFNRVLDIYQKNNHPNAYQCLENFSEFHLKKSDIAAHNKDIKGAQNFKTQAITNLKQALEIVKTHFPVDSPHITRIQDKIKRLEEG